jgi:hypothetical protein
MRMPTKRFSPRKPRRSLRLAKAASVSWTEDDNVRHSRPIAAIPQPARDNLADQRRIIEVCRRVLGDQHKVHVPRHGAPGTYSFIQLKTFAKLPYAVWGFSLGSIRRKYWLGLTKATGDYTLSYIRSPNIIRRSHNRHVLVLMFTYDHRFSPNFFTFF